MVWRALTHGPGARRALPVQLKLLLKGTIEPAVQTLHAAIDFASFGTAGEEPDLDAINDEANGAAALTSVGGEGGDTVQVELKTRAGLATISVPKTALSAGALDASALSLDAFLGALVRPRAPSGFARRPL